MTGKQEIPFHGKFNRIRRFFHVPAQESKHRDLIRRTGNRVDTDLKRFQFRTAGNHIAHVRRQTAPPLKRRSRTPQQPLFMTIAAPVDMSEFTHHKRTVKKTGSRGRGKRQTAITNRTVLRHNILSVLFPRMSMIIVEHQQPETGTGGNTAQVGTHVPVG